MRSATCFLAGLTGVCLFADLALGDSWAAPRPSVFASDCGRYWVKTSLDGWRKATATLCTYDRNLALKHATNGRQELREKVIWSQSLGYIPARMLVSGRGWVVGVNQYARLGYNHSLVIWNPKGDRLADYTLEDLLTPDEIRAHVMQSTSSRRWNAAFEFQHDGYQGTYDFLLVRARDSMFHGDESWKKLITVDLRTGKIWPDFDPDGFGYSYAAMQHAISKYRAKYSGPTETAKDQDAGDDFVRLFARQNKSASAWELYVEADGTAVLRIECSEETQFKLGPKQMSQLKKTLRESNFSGLPETLQGVNNDPHLRSIIVETGSGTSGMTLFSPNQLTDGEERKQARCFIDCWLVIRDLFDNSNAVDERVEIRGFKP